MTDMRFPVPNAKRHDPDGAFLAFLRSVQDAGAPLSGLKVVWRKNHLLGMDITPDDSQTAWPLAAPGDYVVWDGKQWKREAGHETGRPSPPAEGRRGAPAMR